MHGSISYKYSLFTSSLNLFDYQSLQEVENKMSFSVAAVIKKSYLFKNSYCTSLSVQYRYNFGEGTGLHTNLKGVLVVSMGLKMRFQ